MSKYLTKDNRHILLCIVLVILIGFVFFLNIQAIPWPENVEEGFYMRLATERIWHLPTPFFLAQDSSVSPQLPMPPFYTYVLYSLFSVFGVSLLVVRLFGMLMVVLIVFAVAYLSKFILSKKATLISIVGLLGYWVFWFYGKSGLPHIFVACLLFISFVTLYAWQKTSKKSFLISSIVFATLAIFVSYWALCYILFLPFIAFKKSDRISLVSFVPLLSLGVFWFFKYLLLGRVFIEDFKALFFWQSSGGLLVSPSAFELVFSPVGRVTEFFLQSPIALLSFIGLFTLRDRWLKKRLL